MCVEGENLAGVKRGEEMGVMHERRGAVGLSEISSVAVVLFGCDPCNKVKIPETNFFPSQLLIISHLAMFAALQAHSPFYSHQRIWKS